MRVIAGEHGGRRIKDVPGSTTRSTTDKVKEASFHRIGPFFDGGTCLDLFAGSGALGIEALSRGMDSAIFIETHSKAIKVIHENTKALKLEGQCVIKRRDALRALEEFKKDKQSFDLILIDPPYDSILYEEVLHKIFKNELLSDQGIIYCEHDKKLVLSWDELPFKVSHTSTYGTITTTLLTL